MPLSYPLVTIREINSDDHLTDERIIPFEKPPRIVVDKKSLFFNKLRHPTKMFFHPNKTLKNPCNYSVTVVEHTCTIELTSYLTPSRRQEQKPKNAWGKVLKYGVEAEFINAGVMQQPEEGGDITCKQTMRISLSEGQDWGMIQLRSQNVSMRYRGIRHSYNDILTYFFYRNIESVSNYSFPPMIVANRFLGQNYIPVTPGQLLMVVAGNEFILHDMQSEEGYQCFRLEDEQTVGNKFAAIYQCVGTPQVRECMLISNAEADRHYGLHLPTVYRNETLAYIMIFEPQQAMYVNCETINALCIRFIADIPIIKTCQHINVERVDTEMQEVLILLDKEVQGLTMTKISGKLEFKAELK